MELGISGLASGFDWRSFVDQIVDVERAPQKALLLEQDTIQQKKLAYSSIQTQLSVLQTRVQTLADPTLFSSRTATNSNESVASVTANPSAPLGKFDFNIIQLGAAAKLNGAANIGAPLSASADVSGVSLSSGGFARSITGGTFTINGAQVTVDPAGSLQDVFTAIETATGGAVTASYDPGSDAITLASAGEIVLGSATDSSNFLLATKLYNNGTGSIASTGALGGLKLSESLASGNFSTAIDDGGAGVFKINGIEINYTTSDTLDEVIARINQSEAGVTAAYDATADRLVLRNKDTGDIGIAVQDVTGNFATATGLATGSLERGRNLLYSVNGGGTLVSTSNTISEATSGISGLTVNALTEGQVSITVGSDSAKVKTAIQDFITEFNKIQSIIETNTASSTDAKGKVTAGTLADESDASTIARELRSTAYAILGDFAVSMNQLEDLGIVTNGNDNSLALEDEEALDAALANDLAGVSKLFTDADQGLAVKLDAYLEKLSGDSGFLPTKEAKLVKDIAAIDTQISDLERLVQSNRQRLIDSFIVMEAAQAQINQQLQFLAQRFSGSSAR